MLLVLDVQRGRLIQSVGFTALLAEIALQRCAAEKIHIHFRKDNATYALPVGTFTIQLIVRPRGSYQGTELAFCNTFTLDATSGFYVGTLNLITVNLDAALGTDTSIDVDVQVAWRETAGDFQLTQNVPGTVANGPHQGGEVPVEASGIVFGVDEAGHLTVATATYEGFVPTNEGAP